MTKINYLLTKGSVSLNYGGVSKTVAKEDPRFDRILAAIRANKLESIPEIVDPTADLVKAGFEVDEGIVSVEGMEMPPELNLRILEYRNKGIPFQSLLNFWAKLQSNPSFHTRQFLFKFLENQGHPLTEDGCFIGYRGVREDFKDSHSGKFDNTPGQVCRMPRHMVDDDHTKSCSYGLHVGGYEMAKGFGPKMVIVKVDPINVVAVPDAYAGNKLRVCEFEVLSEAQAALQEAVVDAKGKKIESFTADAPYSTGDEIDGDALSLFEEVEKDTKAKNFLDAHPLKMTAAQKRKHKKRYANNHAKRGKNGQFVPKKKRK